MRGFGDASAISVSSPAVPSGVFAPSQPEGFQIPDMPCDWYSYPLTFVNLAAATTRYTVPGVPQTQQLQIDAASDFYWTALSMVSEAGTNTTPLNYGTVIVPIVSILINDGGSNRNLMQNPVPLGTVAGDGRWPHYLQHPRLFKKNSTIQVTLANLDATNAYNISLNFEGFKQYGVS